MELVKFALEEWKKTPQFQIEDAYKWLYQATLGGEHAIKDKDKAFKWLEQEWQMLDEPQIDEILWQPLDYSQEIGRLNLRPFRNQSGDMNELLDAFVQSSSIFKHDKSKFIEVWVELSKHLMQDSQGQLISWQNWNILDEEAKLKNYPAIHHSRLYSQHYKPAYRVITSTFAQQLIASSFIKHKSLNLNVQAH